MESIRVFLFHGPLKKKISIYSHSHNASISMEFLYYFIKILKESHGDYTGIR